MGRLAAIEEALEKARMALQEVPTTRQALKHIDECLDDLRKQMAEMRKKIDAN